MLLLRKLDGVQGQHWKERGVQLKRRMLQVAVDYDKGHRTLLRVSCVMPSLCETLRDSAESIPLLASAQMAQIVTW